MGEKVFLFDDDENSLLPTKYTFGSKIQKEAAIRGYSMSFAYDYISLKHSNLCFNNNNIIVDDFHQVYYLQKELSLMSINDLYNNSDNYRFHTIPFETKQWLLERLGKILNVDITKQAVKDQLPDIYQIEVYTDKILKKAPRTVGFIGNYGIFHLLWFDYNHSIYPMATS